MDDLIARLENAAGPSLELDCAIFEAVLPAEWFESKVINWFNDGGRFGCNTEDGYRHLDCLKAPAYTASVDAALTLVPEGVEYSISTLYHVADVEVGLNCSDAGGPWHARRKDMNVSLALCIAALKARAALAGIRR